MIVLQFNWRLFCQIYETFKNTYFKENLRTTASLSFDRPNFGDLFKHRGRENLKSFADCCNCHCYIVTLMVLFYIFHSAPTKIVLRYFCKFFEFLVKFNNFCYCSFCKERLTNIKFTLDNTHIK